MGNPRLYKIGVRLVKFAWVVEIIAVLIGFLISIIVAYAAYDAINHVDKDMTFNDYSSIFVAGLPFLLVAVVEATKIPIATALMYAKHTSWRIMLFIGVLLLVTITFETMMNGFERNFSNLTFAIQERKNEALLLQGKIDDIEDKKRVIDTIKAEDIETEYANTLSKANANFNQQVERQSEYIQNQLKNIDRNFKEKIDAELNELYDKESKIYEAWDKERETMQKRLRNLLNQNLKGAGADKQKLSQELDNLKAEMKRKMKNANFLTRPGIERKYRELIEKKEKRLYKVSDFAAGTKALDQQTGTEKQLQKQLQIIGNNYQKRIDAIRVRIDYLNNQLKEQQKSNEEQQKKYRSELANFTSTAIQNKSNIIQRANIRKKELYEDYKEIQSKLKLLDNEIFGLKKEQTELEYEMNKMVNQNQVYRVAAYISDKENGLDVPKNIVGLVALIWFASLAFISAITGVFLAIAGIYIQKCYNPELTN
jgi:hypothetical protein